MLIEHVKNMSPMDRLIYWIKERESIRLKKEMREPWPWTDDTILQTYRFCNVRRMDDKVSRWLLTNWYKPNKNHENILLAATLARQLNNTDSLKAIGFPHTWDPKKVDRVLHDRAAKGLKNFGAAYMITGTLGGTKANQIVWKVAHKLQENLPVLDLTSLEKSANALLPYNGFSHFIAGQVVADLRWCLSGSWGDRHTWAPKGPGSRRGINILLGRELDALMNVQFFLSAFRDIMAEVKERIPESISKRLEAHDYQNCLCESFKYHKTIFGLGRPKQIYRRGENA